MKRAVIALLITTLAASGAVSAANLRPRLQFEKYLFAEGVNPKARHLDRIIVKFFDEDMVRLQNNQLTSTNSHASLAATSSFLASHPEISVQGVITDESEESYQTRIRRAEEMSGKDLVDLFSFYKFVLPAPAQDPKALLAEILAAPEVEIAYYEGIPVPFLCTDAGATTPNFIPNQTYHDPAPLGVDLDYARATFGVEVTDGVSTTNTGVIETGGNFAAGFNLYHEDFTTIVNATPESTPDSTKSHGTAVGGIVGACDENNVGIIGFTADHTIRFYDIGALATVAAVYNRVNAQLDAGEYTTNSWGWFSDPMPPGQSCPCNPDQNGVVPPEYDPATKTAIENGTALGIHYFLSAGNGCVNLDHPVYGNTFRWSTDTWSCYVGGVKSTGDHDAICYTNWGERVTLNAWAENIMSLGYGDAHSGFGRREYYTYDFGGTSGAGPIVAGTAGVLNNVYRDLNSGSNISPTTMRSWLTINATPPGNVVPGNIGVMPNLFGIMAPDVAPYVPGGWDFSVVPRNTDDAASNNVPLPTILNSDPSATYWNSAVVNWSRISEVPAYRRIYRDDVYIVWCGGTLSPYTWGWCGNIQSNVRGGRHTVRLTADPLSEVVESDEGNNDFVTQFVWDPRDLTSDNPLTFSHPPTKLVTGQPGTYYNCDGYQGQTNFGGWWDVLAVMAGASDADYDARVYSEAVSSQNGFDTYEAWSGQVGPVDFVGINNNVLGSGVKLLASAINWDDNSTNYLVEAQTSVNFGSVGVGRNLETTATIGTDEILENYEFLVLAADSEQTFTIEVEVTSGNADLAISVFGPDDDYFSSTQRNAFANNGGAGESEILHFVPGRNGYFGIVVHKYDFGSWNESASFNLYIGKTQFDLTHYLRPGWSHEVVVRQAVSSEPITLPAVLNGNESTNRFFAGYINQGGASSPSGLNDRFYVDGPSAWTTGSWASWPAGATTWWGNQGPVLIFGGRHNVGDSIDVFQEGAEWREDNNRHDEQFVWTPYPMNNLTAYSTVNPAPGWRNQQSATLFSYWNQDGWRFTGSNRWSGAASVPTDPDDEYNLALFNPTTGSENGFDTRLTQSWGTSGGWLTFVVENGNSNGATSYDLGVSNNWAYPYDISDGPYRMFQCNSIQDLVVNASNGPFTLGNNQLIHVFDLPLTNGVPMRIILDNLSTVDLGLAIFDADDAYGSRTSNGTVINSFGDGLDEFITFVPTSTGRHGIVVFKHDLTDVGSAQYRLIVGNRTPAVPQRLVIGVLNSSGNPIQMVAHWDSVLTDVNGAPMNVDHYELWVSYSSTAVFPTGWLQFTSTTLATLNFGVSTSVAYFQMVVVAVDSDGYVLAHSPLPDGSDLTGTRVSTAHIEAPGSPPVLGEVPSADSGGSPLQQ